VTPSRAALATTGSRLAPVVVAGLAALAVGVLFVAGGHRRKTRRQH
jgi:hypothetical protein